MTARKPLVLVGGVPAELPSADTLAGAGGAWTQIDSVAASGANAAIFSSIPTIYQDLLLVLEALVPNQNSFFQLSLANQGAPSTFGTARGTQSVTSGGAYSGVVFIPRYMGAAGAWFSTWALASANDHTLFAPNAAGWQETGGIGGVKLTTTSGTWTSGTIRLLGK